MAPGDGSDRVPVVIAGAGPAGLVAAEDGQDPVELGQGGPAGPLAQVVELGAADVAAGGDLDALDLRRVHGERALHADAEGLLAHGERLPHAGALALDHHALEDLRPPPRALHDLEVHAHAIARPSNAALQGRPDPQSPADFGDVEVRALKRERRCARHDPQAIEPDGGGVVLEVGDVGDAQVHGGGGRVLLSLRGHQ